MADAYSKGGSVSRGNGRAPESLPSVVALMGYSPGTGNLGCEALGEGTMQGLFECAPGIDLSVIEARRKATTLRFRQNGRDKSVPVHALQFSPRALGPDQAGVVWVKALLWRLLPVKSLRARLVGRSAALGALVGADAVLDISGGDSFADIYGNRRMAFRFVLKLLPLILGKRLVLLPQTIGPFRRYPWRALARFVLNRSAVIYSRDEAGVAEVMRFMGNPPAGRVRYAPDVAFLVAPAADGNMPQEGRTPARTTIGVNVSGLLWNGGYTRQNQFGLKGNYQNIVTSLLRELLQDEGVRVLLVPHVITSWGGGAENDEEACRVVRDALPQTLQERTQVVYALRSAGGAKAVIGGCCFFIGSRMHSCVAALSQCIPTVGIAYSDKLRGTFESLEVGDCVADARRENEEGILRIVREAMARRDEIRTTLARTVPIVQEQVRSAFRDIAELIPGGTHQH